MKTVEQWFEEYGESHQNPVNKKIHWVCVPVITFCVIGLFWVASSWLTWFFLAGSLAFYLSLSVRLAAAMVLTIIMMLVVILALQSFGQMVLLSTVTSLFIVAWIFQFWGHQIEGKKPSFFKDVQFLLIGPLWVLAFLFRKAGIQY